MSNQFKNREFIIFNLISTILTTTECTNPNLQL